MNELGESFKLVRSELHTLEHNLTSTSELFQRLLQQSAPLQSEWQQAEKKMAELKMTLEQKQSLFQQNTTMLNQLEQQKVQTKERLKLIELQLENLYQQQEQLDEQTQQQEQQHQGRTQDIQLLKAQQQQVGQQFEQLKQQVEKQQQQKMQMLAQTEQLLKNIGRIEQQRETLHTQIAQLQQQYESDELEQRHTEKQQLQQQIEVLELQINTRKQKIIGLESVYTQKSSKLGELKSSIQILYSEQKNLKQLMTQYGPVIQKDQVQLVQILKLNKQAKPYASLIEKFLSKWLTAHVLETGQSFSENISRQLKGHSDELIQLDHLPCLANWIETPHYSLWTQVAVATTLSEALYLKDKLHTGQSILTLDGYHVGADWAIALYYDDDSQAGQGMLSHRIRLEEIEALLMQSGEQLEQQEAQLLTVKQQVQTEQHQQQLQLDLLKQQQTVLQQLDISIAKIQSTAQALKLQQQQLHIQLQQFDLQLQEDAMQKDDLEIDLHALDLKLEQILPNYKAQQFQFEELTEQLESTQQNLQHAQQELDLIRRQAMQTKQQIELLEKDASFLKVQYQQIITQIEQSKKFVDPIQLELPNLESQFSQQQQLTENLEKSWHKWQVELNQIQEKQQQLTEQRYRFQQQDESLRTELEEKRLAWQAAKSDFLHYTEQLKELNSEPVLGLKIDLSGHQQQLEKIQQKFEKIGAVNLAASQEYDEVSQRFEELIHQMRDLENTVEQLKNAMKSIDQETRKLFMSTFDQVNAELQVLFPKVFNGGEASLSLEDDWQSGIKLMARPPGKRNSSLALLSGGEKALTALALVFAIFRLNPAPFCVLDEVDAPLDDANVQRFCNLVKELSEQVQFIYITHNKIAMTMATDLLGVTMPEPGTSKLVTVNLEQAKEYGLVAEA